MPSGCLGGTFGGLGDTFGVIWGSWWHVRPTSEGLGGTFGLIWGVLVTLLASWGPSWAVLGGKARQRSKKWPSLPVVAWLFGVVFDTQIAPKMNQKMDLPKRTNKC